MRKALVKFMYFALSIPMYYIYTGGFSFGGIYFQYCFLAAILLVLFTFFVFLVYPNPERMVKVLKYAGILTIPYIITMIWSLMVWVLNLTRIRVILRGFVWPSYDILAIFAAASAVYLFGKKGVYYQLISLLAAYVLFFAGLASKYGIAVFFNDYLNVILTRGDVTGCFAEIEKIAYAHGMGMFLIYLVLTLKENRRYNLIFLLPALLCFFSGFKRSALVGMVLTVVIYIIGCRLSEINLKGYFAVVGILMVIGAFLYIGVIDSTLFDVIVEIFNINTMGRQEVYEYMKDYYDFSITFLGKGLGFISYNIAHGIIDVGGNWRGDIHNDFLRQYIELGMIGYIIWAWTFFSFRVRQMAKMADGKLGLFVMSCMGYCWGCFLTENMYYRFNAGLALAVVILSYCIQRDEEKEKQLEFY
ncbi:MAG: O-antigen ligase family protein [Clostridiales bacterium]|nr:O-antigen ligase family protein [Clostridiales bacterium]